MARRATSLGPKPSLFIYFCVLLFVFFVFVLVFFGGFKGQVRWPEGPPHLALNPPYLFLLVCLFFLLVSFAFFLVVFSFLSLLLSEKPVFPLKKGIFCLFLSVSLCFSSAFFGLPLVQVLFLCLSLVLFFLSSFLSFFFCFLLVPSFSLFLSFSVFFGFVSWKANNIKRFNCKVFFHQSCVFFWFPVLFSLSNPFFLSLFFSWYSVMFFCSTSMFLVSKNTSWKTPNFGQKGSCNKTVFYNLCFAKCEKLSFFWPLFGKFLVDVKKHYRIGMSAHFQSKKRKKKKKDHFEGLLSGPSKGYYLGQACCNIKMANLAQIITLQIFVHTFFQTKKVPKPLFL